MNALYNYKAGVEPWRISKLLDVLLFLLLFFVSLATALSGNCCFISNPKSFGTDAAMMMMISLPAPSNNVCSSPARNCFVSFTIL